MKTNSNSIDHNVISSAIKNRLDKEAAREAAAVDTGTIASETIAGRRGPHEIERRQEMTKFVRMISPVQCPACNGRGYSEREERADAPSYHFVERNTATPQPGTQKLPDQVHVVAPPVTRVRSLCELCEGSRSVPSAMMLDLLRALLDALRADASDRAAAAADIEAFNARARATLAERTKAHEAARLRHEEADRIEREALERAALLREGKSPDGGEAQS